MSDNPYQSPAETSTGNSSAETLGQDGPQRLGGFICTVLVFDCVPCSLKLYGCLISLRAWGHSTDAFAYAYPFLLAGIAIFGLSGNIFILLKKRIGIPFAVSGLALAIIVDAECAWTYLHMSLSLQATMRAVLMVMTLLAACWSIVYGIVLWKAAKKLGWLRRNARAEDRAA